MLPILSEYESVSDAILGVESAREVVGKTRLEKNESKDSFGTASKESDLGNQIQEQSDPFESTLNEYNNLTNRCNEIIGMFEERAQAANNSQITGNIK